eukprot:comp24236_c0_seq1/m.44799 comp24236_c0_seq1/g.44799  ORF comp24236_c0_seq1/g.44799 comp24236_c0_seq1/m.44799 type:complete len:389 (-) comp24236_c0_seq1:43-1209(-)
MALVAPRAAWGASDHGQPTARPADNGAGCREPLAGRVSCVAFVRDHTGAAHTATDGARYFVAATRGRDTHVKGGVELWGCRAGEERPLQPRGRASSSGTCAGDVISMAATAAEGGRAVVYAGTSDGRVLVHTVTGLGTGDECLHAVHALQLHTHPLGRPSAVTVLAVSPGGSHVLSGGEDGCVRVTATRDLDSPQGPPAGTVGQIEGTSIGAAAFADAHTVLLAGSTAPLRVWDMRRPRDHAQALGSAGDGWEVSGRLALRALEGSTYVATAGSSGLLRLWDLRHTQGPLHVHSVAGPYDLDAPVWGLHLPVHFGRNRQYVAYAAVGCTVSRLDLSPVYRRTAQGLGEQLDRRVLVRDGLQVNSLDSDGRVLLCGSESAALCVRQLDQ